MPDIQALTLRAEQLGHAVGSWNTWILVTMVAAALAATGLVYVQRRAFQTAKDWADANQALGAAKEAVLRKQVADANERAGNANKEAARANEAAGKANEAAGKAKEAAGKALERAGVLEKEAADERVTAEQLRQQNLATEGRLTAANRVLEEERLRRLELEKSLAPRDLPFILYVDGTTNVDDLKQFPGIEVELEYIRDAEAGRTASVLRCLFENAGWKVVSAHETDKSILNGVTIEQYWPPQEEEEARRGGWMKSGEVAMIVAEWLRVNNWVARSGHSDRGSLPPNGLRVLVGFKPNPYFNDPQSKAMQSKTDEIMRRLHPLRADVNKNKPISGIIGCDLPFSPVIEKPK